MQTMVARLATEIRQQVAKVIVGQQDVLNELLAVFLAGGNVLLEGYPGLGKTLLAKCLAGCLDLDFKRVQFTPDLMPADLLGTRIFDFQQNQFVFVRGPLFTEVLLADEINRTPPKTQAALLEAMEERQNTIAGETHRLSQEFFVIATQNPLELEGTYPLPEAMLDRFWCKIVMAYPGPEEERAILDLYDAGMVNQQVLETRIQPVIGETEIAEYRRQVRAVRVASEIKAYLLNLVHRTRTDPRVAWGLSPRAALIWMHLAKAWAAMAGREYVIPDDLKRLAHPVMRHRLLLRPEAQIQHPDVEPLITELVESVPVPV